MLSRSIDALEVADIAALVENQISESRTLEFKRQLPGNSDADKREFLADVSAFANAAGGDLIFGVAEGQGVAVAAEGVAVADEGAERLRLEAILRDGIKPRLPLVQFKFIPTSPGCAIVLLRIPASNASPHMVTFQNTSKFFSRSSAGKWQLDVDEIRGAFAGRSAIADRMTAWHRDRVAVVSCNRGPAPVADGPRLVIHLLPNEAFRLPRDLGIAALRSQAQRFNGFRQSYSSSRVNADGILLSAPSSGAQLLVRGYCQLHRNGCVEAVIGDLAAPAHQRVGIPSQWVEHSIVRGCQDAMRGLSMLEVGGPITIRASLLAAEGHLLWVSHSAFFIEDQHPCDRACVELPEVTVDDASPVTDDLLRPMIDGLWNAFGFDQSRNFTADGKWSPR